MDDHFPLEAYVTPPPPANQANPSPHHPRDKDSSHPQLDTQPAAEPTSSSMRSIHYLFTALLRCWICYLIWEGTTRVACFNVFFPASLRPPNFVCSSVSPSLGQFWDTVFREDLNSTPRSIDWHIESLRRLLALPRERDFALRGSGASILADFTSPTYSLPSHRNGGNSHPGINLPTIILEEQVLIGDCWEFAGPNGQVGIKLSEEMNITSLTITSPDPEFISSGMRRRSPHVITLWALTDVKYLARRVALPSDEIRRPVDLSMSNRVPTHFPSDHAFLPIFRILYNSELPRGTQTFPRHHYFRGDHTVLTQNIVLEVSGNWGASTTCIYHIGIHGGPTRP